MKPLPNQSQAGGLRGGLLLIILVLGALWYGGQGVYTAYRNQKITSLTLAEYEKQRPDAEWIEFKGAYLDIPETVTMSRKGKIESLYIPLRPDAGGDEMIHVVLHTKSMDYLRLADELNTIKSPEEAKKFLLTNMDRIYPKKDVQGLVEFGVNLKEKERSQVEKLNTKLAPNFVIISDGEKPNMPLYGGILAAGIVIPLLVLKSRKNAA